MDLAPQMDGGVNEFFSIVAKKQKSHQKEEQLQ